MKYLIQTIWVIVGFGLVVSAQIPAPGGEYQPPPDKQLDSGCHRLMVDNLRRATNPNDPLQQQYLWAADAYRQLSEAYQSCE